MNEYRDSSDRLTFDFRNIEAAEYSKITSEVVSHFSLEVSSTKTCSLDEVFQDFKRGLKWLV